MFSLLFLLGAFLALQLIGLPDASWLWFFLPCLYFLYRFPRWRLYAALPLGFLWVIAHAVGGLSSELPDTLIKKDVLVIGEISSLPDKNSFRTRFVFDVSAMFFEGEAIEGPKRIRLNWYGRVPDIQGGQVWQLQVRLKPAHGMLNPGGFDYEKWLFEKGIRATGYVRESDKTALLQEPGAFDALHFRARLKNTIHRFLPDNDFRGLVLALAIGDRSEITEAQWQVLTATGTNHLVAISGLHIGLVAGGVYFIAAFFMRRIPALLTHIAAHKVAAICALIAAFLYAMLAGFAIPTQRALVMTSVVMLGVLINKRFSYFQVLGFALFAVVLLDPFSILSAGFWLSFIAVAAILYAMQSRQKPEGLWWKWGRTQWIVSVALAPVLIFTFQRFSLVSPLANVVAVPWVSLLTVPLLLAGLLLSFVDPLGQVLVFLASESLKWLWEILSALASLSYAQWQQFLPQSWTLLPAFVGVLLLISPRGFPARYLAFIFLMPLLLVRPERLASNELSIQVLDVGQGLSVVAQTRHHVLVYDTGPGFRNGFNTGEAVVLPFLKSQAIDKLDVLLLSHGDNDHIGGMSDILEALPIDTIISGDMKKTAQMNAIPCVAGEGWVWDGVQFDMLHPDETEYRGKGNNGSCVLKISAGDKSILLTGDIEKEAEQYLLEKYSDNIRSNILLAAHHGSNTSSTEDFIQGVMPEWVFFPAGYGNRFNFPSAKVTARYRQAGVKQLTTGLHGAISVRLKDGMPISPKSYRRENARFWHSDQALSDGLP
ncbi:MAG TPA: DNA internalization-related competence protein ComEC/Rec2 [Gammaproteobacteria bacterium]|nr:DNA internalization-related competence protein ComEC/Rec2 [Gammaproteobacteria bacterium]